MTQGNQGSLKLVMSNRAPRFSSDVVNVLEAMCRYTIKISYRVAIALDYFSTTNCLSESLFEISAYCLGKTDHFFLIESKGKLWFNQKVSKQD
jgi:hypothetical protein